MPVQVNKVDIGVNVGRNKSCEKMQSFSVTRKKTPFQKHREEEEAKKKVGTVLYFELKEMCVCVCVFFRGSKFFFVPCVICLN